MNVTPNSDSRVAQLIDANLDRAKEGLRVVEDWCRFGLHRKDLTIVLKNWRQLLGCHHKESYKETRNTANDESTGLSHPAQEKRILPEEIVASNFSRVQEALRVLEEFSRPHDPQLSSLASRIRYEIYDFEITVLKANKRLTRRAKLESCKLCLITNQQANLIETISIALETGVKMIQFRCKQDTDSNKLKKAKEIASMCKSHGALFIVNDRLDIAIATDADGIHLGQEDFPIHTAREIIGPEKLIGLSSHTHEEFKSAQQKDCDYIGLGPLFSSTSKPNKRYLGLDFYKSRVKESKLPLFAIGGINTSNIASVISAGIERVAVISAIMDANEPDQACYKLLEYLK